MEEKGMSYCVAIDGPAGAGKSTIAKEIAKKMQLILIMFETSKASFLQ